MVAFWQGLFGAKEPDRLLPDAFVAAQAKLLPCPFCGSEAAFLLVTRPVRKLRILCRGCDAEMDVTYRSVAVALDKWNSRVEV